MPIYSHVYQTDEKHSAKSLGSGGLMVLATPALVAFLENAAYSFVQENLTDDQTTVGSEIALQHLAASRIGDAVTVNITSLHEEGRKYQFELEAFVGDKLVGKAHHTRVRIGSTAFMEKL